MGTYGTPAYTPESASGVAANGRPLMATLAYYGALLAGVLSIGGAAILLSQAKDLATQTANDLLGPDLAGLVQDGIDQATQTLHSRAIVGLVLGAMVVVLAFAARKAAMWARIVVTLLLLAMDAINIITISDVAGGATKALDIAAIVVSVVAIVGFFLPPTHRYARSLKS
jgi:hypothetical protein